MPPDNLKALEDWAEPIIRQLQPAQRRQLAREALRIIRPSQRNRIRAQLNPDGTPFAPRKPRLRSQTGGIRRKAMFTKLRTARLMRGKVQTDRVVLGWHGRTAGIAAVHQHGLSDRAGDDSPSVKYAQREVLGFTAAELERLAHLVLRHAAEL